MNDDATAAEPVPECSHKQGCALFPLFRDRAALSYWMRSYCDGDHRRCARFKAMEQGSPPPPTLLPNGKHVG